MAVSDWIAARGRDMAGRAKARTVRRPLKAWLLLAAVGVTLLVLLPVCYLVIRAVQGGQASLQALAAGSTVLTLARTVALGASVTLATIVLAVPLALLTERSDLPMPRLVTILLVLPLVIPSYIAAYLLVAFLGPQGMLADFLGQFTAVQQLPSIYGFPGAFILLTLLCLPYVYLPVRAALRGMDPDQEEAGRSLGRSSWTVFRRITLPQLWPAIASGAALVGLYVLRDFGAVAILRYDTFTRVLYVQYRATFDRYSGAALALVLVALALIVLGFDFWSRSKGSLVSRAAGSKRPYRPYRLGRWKPLALAFPLGVIAISLVVPLVVLGFWLVRGLAAGETLALLLRPTLNSLLVAGAAGIIVLAASAPLAILTVRAAGRQSRLLDRLSYLGYALPGIVVALALVYFGLSAAPFLYQTVGMLLLAYLVLFLPLASGALQTSLRQVSPELEEAARSLGESSLGAFRRVTLPLLRPGLGAGFVLVFLTVMKELPATLVLAPLDFSTLATSVWSAVSEAFFARAALPALLLILLSSLPLILMMNREYDL